MVVEFPEMQFVLLGLGAIFIALYLAARYGVVAAIVLVRRLRRATPDPIGAARAALDEGKERFVWFLRTEDWDEAKEEKMFAAVEAMGWNLVAARTFGRGGGIERTFVRYEE